MIAPATLERQGDVLRFAVQSCGGLLKKGVLRFALQSYGGLLKKGVLRFAVQSYGGLQGYLAHMKTLPPLGPPRGPRRSPTVGS